MIAMIIAMIAIVFAMIAMIIAMIATILPTPGKWLQIVTYSENFNVLRFSLFL